MVPEGDPPVPDEVPAGPAEPAGSPPPSESADPAASSPSSESPAPAASPPPTAAAGDAPDRDFEVQGETVEAGPDVPAAPPPTPAPPRRESPLVAGLAFAWRFNRAILAVVAVQLLFGLSIALPFRAKVGPHLDLHAHASAFAGEPDSFDQNTGWEAGLDWGVWADIKRREAPFFEGLGLAMVWIGVLAWLFGQAVSGGFLGAAADDVAARAAGTPSPAKGRVARFLAAAGTWFFPSLRVSLVFLATMLVARRVIFEIWGGIAGEAEAAAPSQAVSWWAMRWREGVFLAVFLVFRVAADLGRAHLVVRGRRSAFLAFLRGLGTLARHPFKAGGLALLVAVPEMLLLAALARLIPGFPESSTLELVALFLVLEIAVLVRWSARAVLLAGNARLLAR